MKDFNTRILSFSLLLVLALALLASAEMDWQQQQVPSDFQAEDIFFLDTQYGWTAGEQGSVLRTTDGGQTWIVRKADTDDTIYSLFFHDATNGWAVAGDGNLFYTSDGGTSWSVKKKLDTYLLDIHFADAMRGWIFAGEGKIYHTSDGGENWTEQATNQWADFYAGYVFDDTKAVAVGYSGFGVYTSNGGSSWPEATTNTGSTLFGLSFIDESNGWASGKGLLLKTSDGGKNWSSQKTFPNELVFDVHFTNANEGWLVTENIAGGDGKIFYTADGGESWNEQSHDAQTNSFKSIAYVDPQNIWIAGRDGSVLKKTSASVLQMQKLFTPENVTSESNFGAAVAISGDYMAVGEPGNSAGYFHAYAKDQSGWRAVGGAVSPPWGDLGLDALGSSLDMDGNRLISGSYGAGTGFEGRAAIWNIDAQNNSIDLEATLELPQEDKWIFAFYGYSVAIYGDVAVVGARNTGAPGGSVYIYERDNASGTWPLAQKISAAYSDGGEFFGHSVSVSENHIVVGAPNDSLPQAGRAGAVYVFEKQQDDWEEIVRINAAAPVTNGNFGHAVDIDGDRIVVAELNGGSARAYLFNHDGASWVEEQNWSGFDVATDDGSVFIGGISVSISGEHLVVGADTTAGTGAATLYTKEGDVWSETALAASGLSPGDGFGFSAAVSDGNVVVGAPSSGDGAAYLYDNLGATSLEEKPRLASETFALYQNYPNPFNPTTTIRYDLPHSARVSLVVYNILGQKVATLIDGPQNAGQKRVKFDAAGLSSGLYIYVFRSSGFTQTKRMVILK